MCTYVIRILGPLKDNKSGVSIGTFSERQMVDKYLYTKCTAIYFALNGLTCSAISRALTSEGLSYSTKSVSLQYTSKR